MNRETELESRMERKAGRKELDQKRTGWLTAGQEGR